ncbi:uncharacterized protein G2W53_004821 [Senna tora]|uniref:Uncharacterized protein n=1 Tax=Senna tora TaxID=362788 RepID=A0A834XDH6_9FABA|nr:uncharacterized protein G2W53_004821 [Senna tora]
MGDFIATLQQGLSTATNSGSDDAGRTRRLQPPRAFSLGYKTENALGGLEVTSAAAAVSCLRHRRWSGSPYCNVAMKSPIFVMTWHAKTSFKI